MHQRQDQRWRFPEGAQGRRQGFLQLVQVGEMPVARHVLRLIPQSFHRVELRTVGRQRHKPQIRRDARVAFGQVETRLVGDDHVQRLRVGLGDLV